MMSGVFAMFPDLYTVNLKIKNKFDRPSLDVYPQVFINPFSDVAKILNNTSFLGHIENLKTQSLNPTEAIKPNNSLLLNWHEEPRQCIFSKKYDFCNYLEFVEYLIFSINDFDKEEIEDYLAHQELCNKLSAFSRTRFEDDTRLYLGPEILIKQEKQEISAFLDDDLGLIDSGKKGSSGKSKI